MIKNSQGKTYVSLDKRIKKYYGEKVIKDGRGGRLQINSFTELSRGVVSVLDSLKEIDIFFDLNLWEVANNTLEPYSLFLDGVRKNALNNASLTREYGMTFIVDCCWNIFYGRRRSSFSSSLDAAKNYLKPKNEYIEWNQLLFSIQLD